MKDLVRLFPELVKKVKSVLSFLQKRLELQKSPVIWFVLLYTKWGERCLHLPTWLLPSQNTPKRSA